MDRKVGLIALYIFLVFFIIFYFFPNSLLTLELKVFDRFSVLSRDVGYFFPKVDSSKHLDDLAIIVIDETTIKRLKKKIPFPRYIYAQLLEKIHKGDPRLIVFDIVFSGESEDKQSDDLLAQTIEGKGNVLFPYANDALGRSLGSDKFFIKDLVPAGYLNKPMDIDSVIRRIRPFDLTVENKVRDYATELYVFGRYYDYDLGSILVDKNKVLINGLKPKKKEEFSRSNFTLRQDNTAWIKYQAGLTGLKKIPMWVVFSDNFDPSVFKDKIVFIGVTAKIFHDIYNTPLGVLSGVEVMANATLMFLDGKFIQESPQWLNWLVLLMFCVFMAFLCFRLPILKGFFFTVSVISIIAAASFGLFLKGYYFNPFKLILICVITYIVINFYKHTSVVLENIHLRRLSTTDELTGLNSFRFLQVVLDHEFQKSLRYKIPLSLIMIDIDNFKKVNDIHGHQNGNVVLRKIGKILLNGVRKADFPTRYGGEELAILLPSSDVEGARKCAENIRRLIEKEEYLMTKQGPLKVTVSMGVSSFPSMNITSSEEMIKLADMALYKAKHQGKNQVVIYSEEGKNS